MWNHEGDSINESEKTSNKIIVLGGASPECVRNMQLHNPLPKICS